MYEPEFLRDAQRQLTVCNACRYCEGYCAVFPALELRAEVGAGDLTYLANLCHDCRDCYTACMFTPPHEFAINIPKVLAAARVRTYEHYGRPRDAGLFRRSVAATAAISLGGIAAVWLAIAAFVGPGVLTTAHRGPGAFYAVAPWLAIIVPALALALYGVGVALAGGWEFARDIRGAPPSGGPRPDASPLRAPLPGGDLRPAPVAWRATLDALTLRFLKGGGAGCYYPRKRGSSARRILHHLVAGGFLAALISTTVAAIEQDILGRMPPFPVLSLPVAFGTAGGVLLIIGTTGLVVLKIRSDAAPASPAMTAMDYAFLVLLDLVAITGMLLLVLRDTRFMPAVLVVHLGLLVGLFVTAPYGKFVHFVYRYLALVRRAGEEHLEAG
ncbi:MAG TPA: tricarballylate utilization 4Fe-4S protein TcuB [bacterium]|nr:tricarballylate utilization 4Fe-4S protein TcuB [bacterium]